jgi:hypothetical protein
MRGRSGSIGACVRLAVRGAGSAEGDQNVEIGGRAARISTFWALYAQKVERGPAGEAGIDVLVVESSKRRNPRRLAATIDVMPTYDP